MKTIGEVISMISLQMYCVFDSKALSYGKPMFFDCDAVAMRAFGQVATDQESQFSQFPADFTLFGIGTWDCATGTFQSFDNGVKNNLGTALECRGNLRVDEDYRNQLNNVPVIKGGEADGR